MEDLDEAWEVGAAERDDSLGLGDLALVVGRIRYRGRGSGVEDVTPVLWILEFRDGKLARFRAFRDPERMLRDVGQNR
jgi:ketosteroid isomerase-like protein